MYPLLSIPLYFENIELVCFPDSQSEGHLPHDEWNLESHLYLSLGFHGSQMIFKKQEKIQKANELEQIHSLYMKNCIGNQAECFLLVHVFPLITHVET